MERLLRLLFLLSPAACLVGCSTHYPKLTVPDAAYAKALEETADQQPDDEDAALQALMNLFEDFTATNLKANTRKVYADTFYFRDGFRQFDRIDALETYMVHSTEPLRSCTFIFSEPVKNPPDYYLRWVMRVNLKRDEPERVDEVIGFSHIRFNPAGQVAFHQYYWDPPDLLYRRFPVANRLIGYVR